MTTSPSGGFFHGVGNLEGDGQLARRMRTTHRRDVLALVPRTASGVPASSTAPGIPGPRLTRASAAPPDSAPP
ncbi:hypothetical protein [Streptomyces noursei]|uniref:hypothetical protein n=1 Tax=Streptomyces noursei TaxID=1971 RepID=UPI0030F04012